MSLSRIAPRVGRQSRRQRKCPPDRRRDGSERGGDAGV